MTYKKIGKDYAHRVIWQKHFGNIPKNCEIHHINGNKLDNRIENLICISKVEHRRIEAGYIKIDDKWYKRCNKCGYTLALDLGYYYDRKRNRYLSICKTCFKAYMRRLYEQVHY